MAVPYFSGSMVLLSGSVTVCGSHLSGGLRLGNYRAVEGNHKSSSRFLVFVCVWGGLVKANVNFRKLVLSVHLRQKNNTSTANTPRPQNLLFYVINIPSTVSSEVFVVICTAL